ncbi:hypothetical protein ACFL6Y_08835 [Elusimicrobiota bacterium]
MMRISYIAICSLTIFLSGCMAKMVQPTGTLNKKTTGTPEAASPRTVSHDYRIIREHLVQGKKDEKHPAVIVVTDAKLSADLKAVGERIRTENYPEAVHFSVYFHDVETEKCLAVYYGAHLIGQQEIDPCTADTPGLKAPR